MRKWFGLLGILLCAGAVLGGAPAAYAQKSNDTLRIVWWDQLSNLNPYRTPLRAGIVLSQHVFDGLVYRDPESLVIKPLLATAWRQIDPTTLEFDLRRGVRFHDGSPFSAEDVLATVESVLTDPLLATPTNFAWLAGAERVDEFRVRLKLRRPFPAALEYIAMVLPILPASARERMGEEAFDTIPIGSGPYRITEVEASHRITLQRFPEYYADSPKGRPAISRIVIQAVADAGAAEAEMVEGRADWTWNVPPARLDALAGIPFLAGTSAETMRVNYLLFDAAGRTGADNPLTRQKVRQAIAYAVDRQTMARTLMPSGARVLDAPCYPTQFGCESSAAIRYPYDPARARALLAEAGYPDGFSTELVSFMLPQYETAVQGYLQAVGITASIVHLQTEEAVARNMAGQNPLFLTNWGSYSLNDVSAILPQLFSAGADGFLPNDDVRDPELKRLVEAGDAAVNPDERRRNYALAIRRASEQMVVLPLFTSIQTYLARRELALRAYPDELPRFFLATWR